MNKQILRTYREFDLDEVSKHLLIMGDLSGDCASCRALGIDFYKAGVCPECETPFKYLTSRRLETHAGERFHLVRRMSEKRPDLAFIDFTDYQKLMGEKKARDFFG